MPWQLPISSMCSSQERVLFTKRLVETCLMEVPLSWTLMCGRNLYRQDRMSIVVILAMFSCRPLSKSHLCVESSIRIVQCNCSVQLMSVMEHPATKLEMSPANNTVAKNVGRIFTEPKQAKQEFSHWQALWLRPSLARCNTTMCGLRC